MQYELISTGKYHILNNLFALPAWLTLPLPKRLALKPRSRFPLRLASPLSFIIPPLVPHGNIIRPLFLLRSHRRREVLFSFLPIHAE